MPVPVYLPKYDPQHEESKILNWMVAEGDSVAEGDPLCEVETDKVNMEVEAPADGKLAGVLHLAGEVAPAASVIAYVLLEGETESAIPAEAQQAHPQTKQPATPIPVANHSVPGASPVAERVARSRNVDLRSVAGSGPGGRILKRDVESHVPTTNGQVRATPAARRLAKQNNLDLALVNGSGPKGRIQAADVQASVVSAICCGCVSSRGSWRANIQAGRDS